MTLKMIAIGLLALMGLSSVMSPKAFRVFLGGLGALCMALFVGFVATGERKADGKPLTVVKRVQELFGVKHDWTASADEIIDDIRQGKGDPSVKDLVPPGSEAAKKITTTQRAVLMPISIDGRYGKESQGDQMVSGMRANIDAYLKLQTKGSADIGVDMLTHKDLDPQFLKVTFVTLKDGRKQPLLVFDENYAQYVRTRGRQKVTQDRLWQLAVIAIGAGAVLLIAFAALKFVNRQAETVDEQDYLQNSNISMV